MSNTNFWKQLFLHLVIPFEAGAVENVMEEDGRTRIDLLDGSVYFITIEKASPHRA